MGTEQELFDVVSWDPEADRDRIPSFHQSVPTKTLTLPDGDQCGQIKNRQTLLQEKSLQRELLRLTHL